MIKSTFQHLLSRPILRFVAALEWADNMKTGRPTRDHDEFHFPLPLKTPRRWRRGAALVTSFSRDSLRNFTLTTPPQTAAEHHRDEARQTGADDRTRNRCRRGIDRAGQSAGATRLCHTAKDIGNEPDTVC